MHQSVSTWCCPARLSRLLEFRQRVVAAHDVQRAARRGAKRHDREDAFRRTGQVLGRPRLVEPAIATADQHRPADHRLVIQQRPQHSKRRRLEQQVGQGLQQRQRMRIGLRVQRPPAGQDGGGLDLRARGMGPWRQAAQFHHAFSDDVAEWLQQCGRRCACGDAALQQARRARAVNPKSPMAAVVPPRAGDAALQARLHQRWAVGIVAEDPSHGTLSRDQVNGTLDGHGGTPG